MLAMTLAAYLFLASTVSSARAANATGAACGQQQIVGARVGKILGGRTAYHGQFPWAVSIQHRGKHFCGGVVLNRRYIITAAHCLQGRARRLLSVVVGEQDLTRSEGSERTYRVSRTTRHNKYKYPSYRHDIALLRLNGEIVWNQFRQPICLPDSSPQQGDSAIAAGWGWLDEFAKGGRPSHVLRHVRVPVLSTDTCAAWFRQSEVRVTPREGQICAGYKRGGKDACQGDSGGPLMSLSGGRYSLVGLVSAGIGCGRPGLPGIYTDVYLYRDWLLKNIAK